MEKQNLKEQDLLLFKAVQENRVTDAKAAIEKGGDINFTDENNASVLMWAAWKTDIDFVRFLVEKGADYTIKGIIHITETSHYGNLTGIAAAEEKEELLRFLIDEINIDVDDTEPQHGTTPRWTALQWAISKDNTKIIKYLLDKGANPNPSYSHTTALHICIQKQNINAFKYMVKAGAKTELSGFRPLLSEACRFKNDRFIEILLDGGANPNADKQAALFFAVGYGSIERVKLLISRGANHNITDAHGHSPLSLAKRLGLKKIEKHLKKLK